MNKRLVILSLIIFALTPGLRSAESRPDLRIQTSPAIALYGEPFSWVISGLLSGEKVTLKAVSRDAARVTWASEAVFKADPAGTVDVSRQAPVSGTYRDADIFGLLWSMKPVDSPSKKPIAYRDNGTAGWTVDLEAVDSSGRKAAARFRCVFQKPEIPLVRVPLEKYGLSGFLYYPAEGGPFPGLLLLGGSEGGLSEARARAFASHGYAALTLAYFGYPNLPDELVEIPLEYFDRAVDWMAAQPKVEADRLGIVGGSKGAEAALLVAGRNPEIKAVAALTPTSHSWEGHTMRFFSPDYRPVASWSVEGKPLPYIPFKVTPEEKAVYAKGELESFVSFFRNGLAEADPALAEKAAIPVEKIRGPILLVSGTDDRIWPAGESCAAIVARLRKTGFRHEVRHVSIEKGGHGSVVPFLITANHGLLIDGDPSGGEPQADARGGYRTWAETLAFLRKALGR